MDKAKDFFKKLRDDKVLMKDFSDNPIATLKKHGIPTDKIPPKVMAALSAGGGTTTTTTTAAAAGAACA